jgi:putative Mg2+ transporter-C (MgtC) family protein
MNLHEIVFSTEINFKTAVFRLLASFVIGMIIGIEREAHSQPAGMRTHILISIGSTLAMLLSIYIPQAYPGFQNGDPGRIAAQVVTGIGFLGAGAILRFGANVRGLTTAASIWSMAMLGMAVGAGLFKVSAVAAAIILFALTIMDIFEKFFFHDRIFKRIEITVRKKTSELHDLQKLIKSLGIRIHEVDFKKNTGETTDKYIFYAYIPVKLDPCAISEKLEKTEGIVAYSVEMVS